MELSHSNLGRKGLSPLHQGALDPAQEMFLNLCVKRQRYRQKGLKPENVGAWEECGYSTTFLKDTVAKCSAGVH